MAKMVGMNVVVKQGWTKKAVALLEENLTEEQYKAALNEHLSFEIDSAINLRKAREILMRVWYRDTEGVERLQEEGRALAMKYPDQLTAINWCMTALVFPAFADIAKLMGKDRHAANCRSEDCGHNARNRRDYIREDRKTGSSKYSGQQ